MRAFWAKTLAIAWKDVVLELRTKEVVTSVLIFALLVIVIFNFAFEPGVESLGLLAPGVLWVTFTFAGVLGLNRSFVLEKDKGCLDGLMLCPVDRSVIYAGKMLGTLLFMLVVEIVALPVFSILFNMPLYPPRLLLIMVLATVGFNAVGTLFSAIAVNTKAREIMLPLLLFPIVVPVIIAAVKATGSILDVKLWGGMSSWPALLLAFDVIFLIISSILFEFVLEE
ncbi:MAG: heme exporter protein CcmB [Chloroflexi bacterium]|nr:heme exporter protein CcmB [Chloroflexota bacterium]